MKLLPIAVLGLCLAGLTTTAAFARDGSLGVVNHPIMVQTHPAGQIADTLKMPDAADTHTMLMHATPSTHSVIPDTGMNARPAFVFSPVG